MASTHDFKKLHVFEILARQCSVTAMWNMATTRTSFATPIRFDVIARTDLQN
jgi:hypothetical protein